MRDTHAELEKHTGGLVIWRSGSSAAIFRGLDYSPGEAAARPAGGGGIGAGSPEPFVIGPWPVARGEAVGNARCSSSEGDGVEAIVGKMPDGDGTADKQEALVGEDHKPVAAAAAALAAGGEDLLAGLGPRWAAWDGSGPAPVDADLLELPPGAPPPAKPYRLLPFGLSARLTNHEMTALRHAARRLQPHFALSKNRGLEAVAVAVMRLWERAEVAKIVVKRGVQNTSSERMAEQLKARSFIPRRLTGCLLLARDKHYIVLYRGKDFLPSSLSSALADRDRSAHDEEELRLQAVRRLSESSGTHLMGGGEDALALAAGGVEEAERLRESWAGWQASEDDQRRRETAAVASKLEAARSIARRLSLARQKKDKAEEELEKLDKLLQLSGPPADLEIITEEERYTFRRLGLRMKAYLELGKRKVFDGIVENMHLHWKHRELVKVIAKESSPEAVEQTARMLEYESGGILVATVSTSKGHAIILYRGKNYARPVELRPRHLLSKRQALKRATEAQRKQSLETHMLQLEKDIVGLSQTLTEAEAETLAANGIVLTSEDQPSIEIREKSTRDPTAARAGRAAGGLAAFQEVDSKDDEELGSHWSGGTVYSKQPSWL
eukprot:SM000124S25935  [mRNA]  locus=s124:186390:189800:+ [translate_table: standard]